MPRGNKWAYTRKQKRKARHIEASMEKSGVSAKTAARRAWATVNKQDGGGRKKRSSSGRKKASSSGSRRKPSTSGSAGRSSSARRKAR